MRIKQSPSSKRKKKKILKAAKGFWGDRSKQYRRVKESTRRALVYAYRDRRTKKRDFRSLWISRISAASRQRGTSYRQFIAGLKKKNILLSRDILAQIAADNPEVFDRLVELVKE